MTIKRLEPQNTHKDARRKVVQLFTAPFNTPNFYQIQKGSTLGDHFHKKNHEYFFILKGVLKINGELFTKHSLFLVEPHIKHTVEAISDVEMMTFNTHAYTPTDTDTYK